MAITHVIHRLRIELKSNDTRTAVRCQDRVSRLVQDELTNQIDAALGQMAATDRHVRIDRLELDLGSLPADRFDQAFAERLKEELVNASERVSPGIRVRSTRAQVNGDRHREPEPRQLTSRQRALEAFRHFITTGRLPWWLNREDWPRTKAELPSLLEEQPHLQFDWLKLIAEHPGRAYRFLAFPELARLLAEHALFEAPEWFETDALKSLSGTSDAITRSRLFAWLTKQLVRNRFPIYPGMSEVLSRLHQTGERTFQSQFEERLNQRRLAGELPSNAFQLLEDVILGRGTETTDVSIQQTDRPEPVDAESGWPTRSAGLAILHPFLLSFLQHAGFLDDRNRFHSGQAERAAETLHFLIHGGDAADESELVLEKALCGLEPNTPVELTGTANRFQKESEELLQAVIGHWSALKDTSVDGLREAFLIRPALFQPVDPPLLRVKSRAYDMLIKRMPWALDRITLPWLKQPIGIQWQLPG